MSFTATARSINGTLRHEVDVNGRHVIVTDEPESLGGTDTGPAPHELLPAMVASCVSTMVMMYAQARDWQLGDIRVEVQYDTDVTPRQCAVRLHLPKGLRSEQIKRLERVAESCPARRALEAGFTFDEELLHDLPNPSAAALA
jgi:putative redox protein